MSAGSSRSKRSLKSGCLAGFGFLFLVGMVFLFLFYQIPKEARDNFGAASPNLSPTNRWLYSFRLVTSKVNLLNPLDSNAAQRSFTIDPGESANSVSYRLEQEGFIRSADAFRSYLIYSGIDTGIQAGQYELSPGWSAIQIASNLQDATPTEVDFVILPGLRVEEIAVILESSGLEFSAMDFLNVVQNPPADWLPPLLANVTNLEGYLFPGAYHFPRSTSVRGVIQAMLNRFDENVSEEMLTGFSNNGLNLQEAVVLASIIQREGVVNEEHPMIASVFYNRLAIGMKLESDPTVQYALGYNRQQKTWWTNPLSSEDLQINSQYNTYQYAGLPPGPISNPGKYALQAVAQPAQTPYYFFRAKCDGTGQHVFSTTYEEHVKNACP